MNKLAKTIAFALFLSVIPTRIWAQDYMSNQAQAVFKSLEANMTQNAQIRDHENGFLFNVFEIENVEERIQLASALATSDIWLCNPTENPGELFIRPNGYHEDIPIYAEFDYLRMTLREEYQAASMLPKEEFREILNSWANNISNDYYNFLIADYLDRANHCMDAEPFCTSDVYTFPSNNSGYSWSGPNYGCLGSSPTNKHSFWYYMRIGVAGNITIKIEAPFDVDFALWGPFTDQITPCPTAAGQTGLLTAACSSCPNNTSSPNFYPSGNLHDCSFSAQSYEYAHVVNGQVGQYFILLITNYNGGSGNITFQKYAGDGETDCGILPPLVDNDGPYCVGQTIHLTAQGQAGATYSWTGPAGFTSNQQNPTRPNCTMNMAGTYTCTITVGSSSNSADTQVVIYPQPTANFNYTTVCQGNATQFTSTSTTNPAGQQMTYQWNFGDGQTSTLQNPTHTYPNAGTYQVTLTVSCGNGLCTNSRTQAVTVYAEPAANAGPDQTIPYGSTAQLSGSGGAGTFNYHWEPANMVTNPNNQNTQTVALTQDQTYTLTVTNPQGDCSSSDQVTIHISGNAMTVNATATPNSICDGSTTQLQANAGGGTGNFTYSWTPTTGLSNPNIYNPIATPTETTTYTCHVSDGQTSQDVSVTVTVHYAGYSEETHYICPDGSYEWHGQTYSDEGDYEFPTTTQYGCDSIITLHLRYYETYDETTIEAAICEGESYYFYGTTYTNSVQTSHTLQTIHGCDSIIRLDLKVWPENQITELPVSLCPEQLPYYYEGDPYEIPLYAGLHIFHLEDIHGCDSTVWVDIDVSDYYIPPVQTEYVCYAAGETPTYIWNPIGAFEFDLHETGLYTDTLPTSACDGIFRLDLNFLEKPEPVHIYDTVCNTYSWYVEGQLIGTYDDDKEAEYHIPLTPYPCSKDYYLHLKVNHESVNNTIVIDGNDPYSLPPDMTQLCDQYDWQFGWDGETYTFTGNTGPEGVTKTILTQQGCDSIATLIIKNMKYTPVPEPIKPNESSTIVFGLPETDSSVTDTAFAAAVVTSTEFFSFQYTFFIEESNPECVWNDCKWTISEPSWAIEPSLTPTLSLNGRYYSECTVHVADRQEDFVVLTATIDNGCGSEERRFYLKSSFLDVDENSNDPIKVNIVPNPNNGQMRLDFENMEGRTAVKVFDMTGNQIDAFETNVSSSRYNYDYTMKHYAEGIYFFVISNNNRVLTKKVVIIR